MCCGNCSQRLRTAGDSQDGRGRWATAVPMKKGMADEGKALSVNTGEANKRLEAMGTGEFAKRIMIPSV